MNALDQIQTILSNYKAGREIDEDEMCLLTGCIVTLLLNDYNGPVLKELEEHFPSELEDAKVEVVREKGNFVKDKTSRGFNTVHFNDYYGAASSIQKSSIASLDCIWLGIDEADPKIMASDAIRLGLPNHGQTTGWVPYEVPEEVLMSTRMHLTRAMAKQLVQILQHFVNTGELPE